MKQCDYRIPDLMLNVLNWVQVLFR